MRLIALAALVLLLTRYGEARRRLVAERDLSTDTVDADSTDVSNRKLVGLNAGLPKASDHLVTKLPGLDENMSTMRA